MGLLDPSTSDGRVIFFLPWLKGTIAGTTDTPCDVTHSPRPTEDEIQFILTEIKNYLNKDVEGKYIFKTSTNILLSSVLRNYKNMCYLYKRNCVNSEFLVTWNVQTRK